MLYYEQCEWDLQLLTSNIESSVSGEVTQVHPACTWRKKGENFKLLTSSPAFPSVFNSFHLWFRHFEAFEDLMTAVCPVLEKAAVCTVAP